MSLVKFRNGGLMPRFSEMIENFFRDDDFDFVSPWRKEAHMPAVNIRETETEFVMDFAAPGLKKDDFVIEVKDNVLLVSCERKFEKEEKEENFTRREFSFTSFKRSFWLPENANADKILAEYKEGVLHVSVPKMKIKEPEKIKTIKIS
jgi:HSP20 family protein